MDKDKMEKMRKRLLVSFLEELPEHIEALNRDLLALEKNPSPEEKAERITTLFRTMHTLKGAARSANLSLLEEVGQRLEDLLEPVRAGSKELGPELVSVLFAAADAIEEAGMRLREQQDLTGTPLEVLLPRLEVLAGDGAGPGPAPASPPPPLAAAPQPQPAVPATPAQASGQRNGVLAPGGPEVQPQEPGSERARKETRKEGPQGDGPVSAHPALSPAPLPPVGDTVPDRAVGGGTVRVSAEKLDAFLARNGELLVARRRVQSRADELAALREFVGRWRAEWRTVEKSIAEFVQPDGNGTAPSSPQRQQGSLTLSTAPRAGATDGKLPRRAAQILGRAGANLRQLEKDLERLATAMVADGRVLKEAAGAIDAEVRRVRMLPFAEACQGLDRMVRDLAHALGKEVELVIEGGDVELDRSVLEGLKDPLRHLVRNAVDHGAQPPEERRTAGKDPRVRLTVGAVLRGAEVEVVVADDGRGLDLEALRATVRKKGLPEPADEGELARVIFLPGFSTSRLITDVSGRGVGLDVVKSRVEALHGTVDVSFTPGQGTRFTLAVPLTLTTLRVLLVSAAGQTFALVNTHAQKLVRVDPGEFRPLEGRAMLALGGTPVPVASLAETLGLPAGGSTWAAGKSPAVIVAAGDRRVAFLVDELLAEQEVVVKSLGARIQRMRYVSAATILPSGQIALVLNTTNLVRRALAQAPAVQAVETPGPRNGEQAAARARKRVLVVDDSVTTRTLEKSILEAAGYEVTVAADGAAAWQMLQEHGADLLVSDIDMPRMDGFILTETVRGSKRFHDLPVVLVTARATEEDRARGIEVGADAYLGKSAFDQKNLLETIAQLL